MSTTAANETQTTTALTLRLPTELAEAVRNYAFLMNMSGNDVIRRAVIDYMKAHAQTDMVRAAFERALEQHKVAFDKLADL